jgi:pimeloyl-ACP methyl ester carboxylesterase
VTHPHDHSGRAAHAPATEERTAREEQAASLVGTQPVWRRAARTDDGLAIAVLDFGGAGPELVLAHATGFCGAVLGPIARHLRGRFRCVAFDERAHGDSDAPPSGNFAWEGFAKDVLAVVRDLGLVRPFGFGHSCGGAALLLAEELAPGTFAGLYCYEPVVYPSDPPLEPSLENNPLSAGALRRRRQFASRDEARQNYRAKPPFSSFAPEALEAFVREGLRERPDGTVELKCDPEHEAQVYAHGLAHRAFGMLDRVRCPVVLACGANTDAFGPPLLEALAARLHDASTVVLSGLDHFGPLEDPASVARSVEATLGR